MAGPRIFDRVLHKLCAYRIEVDVRGQLQQVFVGINEDRFVPSLEEMADPVLPPVYPARVSK